MKNSPANNSHSEPSSFANHTQLTAERNQASRFRSEFFSIVSHELRTPLTPLKLRLEQMQRLLAAENFPETSSRQLAKSLQTCFQQVDRLSRIVEDLIEISRMSSGELELQIEKVQLSELIQKVVSSFSRELKLAACQLTLNLQENTEVNLDPRRLTQALEKLLNNAIKYGSGSSIEIRTYRKGGKIHLLIHDEGIGIDSADQVRIFQCFERATPLSHFGGLGLGLYMVDQILKAHGGTVHVSSQPGQGASFRLSLPAQC